MDENTIIKISLLCIIIGLPLLHFLSEHAFVPVVAFNTIEEQEDSSAVRMTGVVESVRSGKSFSIIKISTRGASDVIVFDNISHIDRGDKIEVFGKKDSYKGKSEIIADSILMS